MTEKVRFCALLILRFAVLPFSAENTMVTGLNGPWPLVL